MEITNNNESSIAFYYYKNDSYTFNSKYLVPSTEADSTSTWTISGLPSGITASSLNEDNLTISGYPTSTGNSTLRLTFTKGSYSTSKNFTLNVTNDGKSISIATTSLPTGYTGVYYSTDLSVNNTTEGNPSYYVSGLPSGLSGNYSGRISGYPSAAGSSKVSMYAIAGGYQSTTKTLTLTVNNPVPRWNTSRPEILIEKVNTNITTPLHPERVLVTLHPQEY